MKKLFKYLCISLALILFLSLAAHMVVLGLYSLVLIVAVCCGFYLFKEKKDE